MKDLNKPKYMICCMKSKSKKSNTNFKVIEFVVSKKSKDNKFYVIEKLGSIDLMNNKLTLNLFSLVFWLSFYPSLNQKAWFFLNKFIFSKKW